MGAGFTFYRPAANPVLKQNIVRPIVNARDRSQRSLHDDCTRFLIQATTNLYNDDVYRENSPLSQLVRKKHVNY